LTHGWQKDVAQLVAEQPALESPESIFERRRVPLNELAWFFLRLGTTAFGGPAAHIAIMEDELVRRRRWLSREKFLDLLGASNLIPGPSSSELAIHIGYLCAGWKGLLIAGSCFILPAALMVACIGWLYVCFGRLPATAGILYGIKPVVIGVVLQALWSLGRTAVKTTFLAFVAVLALVLSVLGVHPLLLLLLAGVVACMRVLRTSRGSFSLLPFLTVGGGILGTTASFSLVSLFLVFLKLGATVFGSGYVLLAFLRADLCVGGANLKDALRLSRGEGHAGGHILPNRPSPLRLAAAAKGEQIAWAFHRLTVPLDSEPLYDCRASAAVPQVKVNHIYIL